MLHKMKCLKDKPVLADILDLLLICIITVIIGLLITNFIILSGHVPSGSMENLIMTDDRILGNRMAYWNADPQRGDVSIFYAPELSRSSDPTVRAQEYFVKRVIGLPGETVTIKEGGIYINGTLLEEPYLDDGTVTYGEKEFQVPAGHYFMVGDNRNNSIDSRSESWGEHRYISREAFRAKVFLKYSLSLQNLHFKAVHSYDKYELANAS